MVNSILLKKSEDWWDTLDSSDKYDIATSDELWDEFVQDACYVNGCEHGTDDLDMDQVVSEWWDSIDDEEKVSIYQINITNESVVKGFDDFIKENYK